MEEDKKTEIPWWQPGMQLFLRLSGWIGGPVIVAVFLGKYLDRKFHSAPWLFLASVGIAFTISMVALVYEGMKEMRKIEQQETRNKKQ